MIRGAQRFAVVTRDPQDRRDGAWLSEGGSRDLDRCRTRYFCQVARGDVDAMLVDTWQATVIARHLGRVVRIGRAAA